MRVLAYTFEADEPARAAREVLIKRFEMQTADAVVAPVADAEVVIVVRTRDENIADVKAVLEQHGGRHATDVPEEWTHGN